MRCAAAITIVCVGVLTTAPGAAAQAQSAAVASPPAKTPAPKAPTAQSPAPTAPAQSAIDPQGYTYDAGNRRDPFVSLMRRGADTQKSVGVRPPGLGGLTAGEITLKGILASRSGYVGIVLGADNKTYIVHSGEALLDGSIRTITSDAMVILQQVNEPLSLQKQRELKKVLRQTEEGR